MPPPVPIFSEKMDDKQQTYFMWPNVNSYFLRCHDHLCFKTNLQRCHGP